VSPIYVDRYGISVPEWPILVTPGQYEVMTAKAIGAQSHAQDQGVARGECAGAAQAHRPAREPRGPPGDVFVADAGQPRDLTAISPRAALEFARRLFETIEPAARRSSGPLTA